MNDVVIIGGGLYGASTAYHLLLREPGLKICIIEPDPGYEHAASARSNGGVRVLFSQLESIQMSQFGHAFYADFPRAMSIDDEPAHLDLYRHGYMLMATEPAQIEDMKLNLDLQRSAGCNVETYDSDSLARRFPALHTEDVLMAVRAPQDMWIDPNTAVTTLMRKARSMGAQLVRQRVVGLNTDNGVMRSVELDNGETIAGQWIVNATGAWGPEICRMAGFEVPVKPLPMMVFYFETRADVDQFGVTIDLGHVSFRPEGAGFISINRRHDLAGSFCWEADQAVFDEQNWPRLAHRVPAFESLKVMSSYCCHYANNHFDGNLLLGAWPTAPDNFLIATGASGHGLQHAPAAGRGLSELILDREFSTLDLQRFGCQRVVDNKPDPERGFVA
ncbi:MAG: FAD-dependent oxidoreductase domain-containing protein 1 [Gammaproteobacteria bacterium]|jgi:FAD-dependent oxidoreductase domain-containing protein 1